MLVRNVIADIIWFFFLFLQGPRGPDGPPGEKGLPGEGIQGQKVVLWKCFLNYLIIGQICFSAWAI